MCSSPKMSTDATSHSAFVRIGAEGAA